MALRDTKMGYATVVLVSVVMVWSGVEAANSDCTEALASVTGCATFLTNPSSTPDQKACCQPLETVLSTPTSFQCLCAQATNSESPAFKNALLLPSACKLAINVSAANCTTAATTPSNTTTPATTTPSSPGSRGFVSASPYSALIAISVLFSFASLV